jgi:hypothetical protein
VSGDVGEAGERTNEGAPGLEAERGHDDQSSSEAELGPEGPSPSRRLLRFPPALYFAGFAVVLISFAALALGGLALLGRGIDASPTGFFWASIVLSVVALALALAALFAPRRR